MVGRVQRMVGVLGYALGYTCSAMVPAAQRGWGVRGVLREPDRTHGLPVERLRAES